MVTLKNNRTTKKSTKKERKWTWKKPNGAPKRSKTSYNLFYEKQRPLIRQELKESKEKIFDKQTKIIAARWRQVSKIEKEPFEQEAVVLKAKYDAEVSEYKKTPLYHEEMKKRMAEKNKNRGKNRTIPNNNNNNNNNNAMVPREIRSIVSTTVTSCSSTMSRSSSPSLFSIQSGRTRVTASDEGLPRSIPDPDTYVTCPSEVSIDTDSTTTNNNNYIERSWYPDDDASSIFYDNCRHRVKDALPSQIAQIDGKYKSESYKDFSQLIDDYNVDGTNNAVTNVLSNSSSYNNYHDDASYATALSTSYNNYNDDSSYVTAYSNLGSKNNSAVSLPQLSIPTSFSTTERLDGYSDDNLLYQPLPSSYGIEGWNSYNNCNKLNNNINNYIPIHKMNRISTNTCTNNQGTPVTHQDDNYHNSIFGSFPKVHPVDEEAIDWFHSEIEFD